MSISFIVATSCRPTIAATLRSIECWPGDEIIVVSDMALNLHMQDFVRSNPYIRCMHHEAGNDWGHAERNFAMQYAKGDYIAHIDDDDVYVTNHRVIMEGMIRQYPLKPIIFRMQYPNGVTLWHAGKRILECGNVGTPMTLLPNNYRGVFGPYYGGDLLYVESYASKAGLASKDFIWCEETTVLIRPHTV